MVRTHTAHGADRWTLPPLRLGKSRCRLIGNTVRQCGLVNPGRNKPTVRTRGRSGRMTPRHLRQNVLSSPSEVTRVRHAMNLTHERKQCQIVLHKRGYWGARADLAWGSTWRLRLRVGACCSCMLLGHGHEQCMPAQVVGEFRVERGGKNRPLTHGHVKFLTSAPLNSRQ